MTTDGRPGHRQRRTGTVVIDGDVTIAPCAIARRADGEDTHPLRRVTAEPAFEKGVTVVTPRTKLEAQEEGGRVLPVPQASTVDQVVKALNTLGVTPRDLIAILQALKAAGALKAEIEIQ